MPRSGRRERRGDSEDDVETGERARLIVTSDGGGNGSWKRIRKWLIMIIILIVVAVLLWILKEEFGISVKTMKGESGKALITFDDELKQCFNTPARDQRVKCPKEHKHGKKCWEVTKERAIPVNCNNMPQIPCWRINQNDLKEIKCPKQDDVTGSKNSN